ncbi:YdcF family protein [Ahrensia sp. R2A130]|uniref:YdcF family protein n=1 Tax=Ahrensia sp. R2A130 TaxID=744979 RepID=UPI0001E0F09A|nr:YdcF family protein [Ahrensia sp. R2A130]EFL89897.1 periplasmic protein [Ahrensia sp. R2A130]
MELKSAYAIVVLGAAVWKDGRASPALERRTRHAIALHQQGLAPILVLSGGLGRHPPTEAKAMAEICMGEGVPQAALLLEGRSTNTFENVAFSAALLREKRVNSVLVVSDAYHLPRAKMCFRYLGFIATGSAAVAGPTTPWYRTARYWLREIVAIPYYRLSLSRRMKALGFNAGDAIGSLSETQKPRLEN